MEPRIHIIALGVEDMKRSLQFYRDGLGFKTTASGDTPPVVFFQTPGVILELYSREGLAEDINPQNPPQGQGFGGITLAHVAKTKEEVEDILKRAEKAGGKIIKPAQDAFWGGYHGYFADPDNYYWEVAYWENWKFDETGTLIVDF